MKKTTEKQQARTREAILKAALNLISRKGLDSLSLREIARRVGYSPAGLYEYFDGKDDILRALARQGDAVLRAKFENVSSNLPAKEYLIQICLTYVDFVINYSEYFLVINKVSSNYNSLEQPAPTESSYFILLQAVTSLITAEEIAPHGGYYREEITYSLWSMAHGMGMLRLNQLRDFEADFDTYNRRAFERFLAGLT